MEIEYKGANCVVISTKKATVVVDPKLSTVGLRDITVKSAIVTATQEGLSGPSDVLVIDRPGEYEVRGVSIKGIPSERMIDHDGTRQNTMYRFVVDDVRIAVIGHTAVPLDEVQLETLGVIDVAIIPVGGNGYTLDGHQAVSVVRQLDPRVVIPTHYADSSLKYEVPQMEVEPFIKELGAPSVEKMTKWKVKNGVLPESLTVIELERTA